MKRLIPAAIIFAVIIGVFISSYMYVTGICKDTTDLVNECVEEYKEKGKNETKAEELEKYWAKKEKVLSIFANHNMVDEIEIEISRLALHSKFDDNTMFFESADTIKSKLHQILEDTKITAHSIF